MKPPKVNLEGFIPGTSWYAIPVSGSRYGIISFTAYADELDKVIKWCQQEAKWARWKER